MKFTLTFKLTIFLTLLTNIILAQSWISFLPANKKKVDLTFYDYKEAFKKYWEPFNIDNSGKYLKNGKVEKAYGWKQFQRWAWDMEGQIDPQTGKFPIQTAQQVYNEYKKVDLNLKSAQTANWKSLGPHQKLLMPGTGRLNCIAFHPNDNNTYWVGSPSGGLWVTINDGNSWTCLTDKNNIMGVSDIVIPTDYDASKTIYIATGDRDAWANRSVGVLKSTDGGNTWNKTGLIYSLNDQKMVYRLLLDPNDNKTIIASTNDGFYKTTNGGDTWLNKLTSMSFIDIEYKPGDFNTIYGSTLYGGGIYTSFDGGANWSLTLDKPNSTRIELAVSQSDANIVYAIVSGGTNVTGSGLEGIYKSSNSGASFTQVFSGSTSNLLGSSIDGSQSGGQGWYDLSIAISPIDPNVIAVGGITCWQSSNGGFDWVNINKGYAYVDFHMLKYRINGGLFACNDGGIFYSDNGSSFIDKTSNLGISQLYKLGVSKAPSDQTLIGAQDCGSKLLIGDTWTWLTQGDVMECIIDYSTVSTQYRIEFGGAYIYRTTDLWKTFTQINPPGAGSGAWVTPFVMDPNDPQTLYTGYADIWKTTNKGNTWTKISNINSAQKIRSIAIAPSNTAMIYIGDIDHIWKTSNGGVSWSEITGSLPLQNSILTSISVKDNDPNLLWITLGGYNFDKVFQSNNGGISWSNISDGLPPIPVYSIVQNTQINNQIHLYVGTEFGVYFKNGTNNWIEYNTNLPKVKTGEIEIYYDTNPANSKLRLASYGRGLWETNLSPEILNAVFNFDTTTIKVYPNPTKGIIIIEGLPINKEIVLSVYDIYGNLIKRIITTSSNAQIDINKEPSGTYILSLNNKTEQFSMKIIKN